MAPNCLRLLGILFFTLSSSTHGGKVQRSLLEVPLEARHHRDATEKMFVDSYAAYKKYAFGHDDLRPVSKGFYDSRNGWGASIVDGLTTMQVMGLDDLFVEAVDFSANINFNETKSPGTVSVFETTIRYIGAFLSAYELSDEKYPILIQKAREVADKLSFAWVGDNSIPFGHLDFTTNIPRKWTSNIAEAGTLVMEWSTLSKYTGNDTYRALAENAFMHIAKLRTPLPGLSPQGIDPSTGISVGGYITWGGGSDSYFEYLIKYARLTNTEDPFYADLWKTAVDSSITYLLKKSTVGDLYYLADYDSAGNIRHVGSHLACFYGGNWLLGGALLDNLTIIDYGLKLTDACWNTYASTATGIGPERFAFISSNGSYTGGASPTASQEEFHNRHGFYSTHSSYILRPEVLESNFYAWRVTGDAKYLDRAASAIESFQKFLPATVAYSGIQDVDNVTSPKIDHMESFWFAEVLKYLYLTFDDPLHISLDEYVFNTECHPFKAPPTRSSYGSRRIGPEQFRLQIL